MNQKEFEIKKNDMRRKNVGREEFASEMSPLSKKAHDLYQAEHTGGLVTRELVELGEEMLVNHPNLATKKATKK